MNWDNIHHFKRSEFVCKCGCGQAEMDAAFIRKLETLRNELRFPLRVTSGYRCPDHNEKVSSTGRTGPHTTGKAADLALSYNGARKALTLISELFNGVGLNQKGESRFIHVDDLTRRIWTY